MMEAYISFWCLQNEDFFHKLFLVKFILVLVHNSNPKFHIFLVRTYSATTAMHFKVEKKKSYYKKDDDEKVRNGNFFA